MRAAVEEEEAEAAAWAMELAAARQVHISLHLPRSPCYLPIDAAPCGRRRLSSRTLALNPPPIPTPTQPQPSP